MQNHNFIDFKFIEKVDTRVNFIIKCEDEDELIELQQMLQCKSKMIVFEKFQQILAKKLIEKNE